MKWFWALLILPAFARAFTGDQDFNGDVRFYKRVETRGRLDFFLPPDEPYFIKASSSTSLVFQVSRQGSITSKTQPAMRAIETGAQSVADTSNTVLTFSSAPYTTPGFFAVSAATVPSGGAGTYSLACWASFAPNNTGRRVLAIRTNGTALTEAQDERIALTSTETKLRAAALTRLTDGDYIDCYAFQTSGSPLNINSAGLSAVKVW